MRRYLMATACAGVLVCATSAWANTMDYGSLEELFGEPVTTSATGSPQRVSDAPVNMEIITADDIRRSGADNIPDILMFVAGVDVRDYAPFDSDVAVRGYNAANSPRVLVLLNGRQIYFDFHSYTAWSTFPAQLSEIRQIEVIKGPNTALFGFNAVGGVINIVTYDPVYDTVNDLTLRGGTQKDRQASGVGTLHFLDGQAGLRLSLGGQATDIVGEDDLVRQNPPYPQGANQRSIYADGRVQLPHGISLSGEADAGYSRILELTVGEYIDWDEYHYDREKVGVDADTSIGYLSVNAYRNYMNYFIAQGFNCPTCLTISSNLYVVQASDLLKPSADHAIRFGLEYRENRGGGSAFLGETFGTDVYSASAMWSWQILSNLALTNSARWDHETFTFAGPLPTENDYSVQQYNRSPIDQPSFNSAAVWTATDQDTLRLSIARGVQTPDMFSTFPMTYQAVAGYSAGTINAFEGSPLIKPSIIMNYEVDWERAVAPLNSKLSLATYYQTTRDVIAAPGDANITSLITGYGFSGNIGQSSAAGGELTFKGSNAAGWHWKATYALITIADDLTVNTSLAEPNSSIDFSRGVPNHIVTASIGRSWDRFEADLATRWQSQFDEVVVNTAGDFQRRTFDNFVTVDARFAWKPVDYLTVAVAGGQINRSSQITDNGVPTQRRVLGSISLHY
jgi:iron complex outermembrane receptor protein